MTHYWERMRIYHHSYTEFFGTGGSGSLYLAYWSYLNTTGTFTTTNWSVCTKHNGSVWTTNYLVSTSDKDIKKDIEELNDDECLNKIVLLTPSKYRYIDETKNLTENKTHDDNDDKSLFI